jgi:predicted dehydrogenase
MTAAPWDKFPVLVAGCGSIGRRHARVLRALGARNLRACDPSEAQRAALAAETPLEAAFASYEQGLASKPSAVFVCTPPKLHVPMAAAALRAGCHVFCEKPLADTLEGIDGLQASVRESKRAFMVGLCFRYHEGLALAKRWLDEGKIGRLVSVRCRMGEHLPTVRPDYRTLFTSQYSGAFDLTHEVDLACWFAGDLPVREVRALHGAFSDIGIRAPDVAEILVRFGDSCLASIHLDFFSRPRQRVTELLGTEGSISVEFASWDECSVSLCEKGAAAWRVQKMRTERDDMFRAEDAEFLRAATDGSPVRCTLAEARRSLEVVTAAQAARPPL